MLRTATTIQNFLKQSVDEHAEVRCIDDQFSLSPYLSGSFNLYHAHVLGNSLIFAKDTANGEGASRRLRALEQAINDSVIIFLPHLTPSLKRSLIKTQQGFITAQGDMYLPQLALVLKANAAKKTRRTRTFNPGQQQAFLYCLLEENAVTQEGLREKTRMSTASASRALSALSDMGLIDYTVSGKTGRKRTYFVLDKTEFFHKGKNLFGDPIKSIEYVPQSLAHDFPVSGLSALAARSELVAPPNKIVAVGPNAGSFDSIDPIERENLCVAQRLSYDPSLFAQNGVVDPFTMLMTIDENDERISIALQEALSAYPWYTD